MELFPLLLIAIVFILGASIGSFLNVVVYRLPAGLSLLNPPSRCPHCLHRLSARDNVPVLGWLWLGGKCRYCKTAIAPRYPIIEAITGLLFVFALWMVAGPLWIDINPVLLVGHWVLLSWLLALALIDIDTMTLPNPLTQSGLVLGLIYQAALGWSQTGSLSGVATYLMGGIVGAVVGIWLLDTIFVVGSIALGQPAMGGGDAKLVALMGAWLGWKSLLLAGFLACALGAIVGSSAMALGLLKRRQPMPFGPFLALGTGIALFFGESIITGYLNLFIPVPGGW
ncbi:MAG: prepilin peptidase [Merismopedia sp. SIO2A8]|nr:prepilin peptidase [Merismopedia sp. SIO2A8]